MKKQSPLGVMLQGLVKGGMYFLFRPKLIWKDKSLKKRAKKEPFVFVCNHTSYYDGLFAGAVFGRFRTYTLVAKDWYDKKPLGTFIKMCRTIPIDRNSPDADWYMASTELIKNNCSLIVFPEGKTSRTGVMNEFKPGAALLASSTNARLVPCAFCGEYKKVFGKRKRVIIGEPVDMTCPPDMRRSLYAKQEIAKVQNTVQLYLDEYRGVENKQTENTDEKDEISVG